MRYEHTVDITAPAHTVWTLWTDVERWPEWTASMRSVRRLDSGPLQVGSKARVSQPRLPTVVWEVTELEPDVSFVWVARGPGAFTEAAHRLAETPTGVRATLVLDQRGPLGTVLGRLTGGLTRRYLTMEADGLKQRAEAG
jgi:uncharacterized protein YndB with AHSA1/START domain